MGVEKRVHPMDEGEVVIDFLDGGIIQEPVEELQRRSWILHL